MGQAAAVLSDAERRGLCEVLTAATLDLVAGCGPTVEVQLFGFGVRLVPPDGLALLAWFLVPDREELFVSVHPTELAWDIDPACADAADQVMALLRAGAAGRMVVCAGPRTQSITATLGDGRTLVASRSTSRFRRPLRSRAPQPARVLAPYPADAGAPRLRDVAEPPAVLTAISDDLAPTVAAAGHRMTRSFDVDGVHGIRSQAGGGAVFGWGTQVRQPDGAIALWIWFDGIDQDLAVMVADTYWFEWRQLDDQDAVRTEAVEVARAALEGRMRRGPKRTASVQLPDGRVVTTEPPPP